MPRPRRGSRADRGIYNQIRPHEGIEVLTPMVLHQVNPTYPRQEVSTEVGSGHLCTERRYTLVQLTSGSLDLHRPAVSGPPECPVRNME
jgi:hypothetical protein